MKLLELKDEIKIDIKGSLERFSGMEILYVKFLKKFIDDKTFDELVVALKEENLVLVGEKAHTLKGVAGNLGLIEVYEKSTELMKLVKEKDVEKIKINIEKLGKEIDVIKKNLKKID